MNHKSVEKLEGKTEDASAASRRRKLKGRGHEQRRGYCPGH